MRRLSTPLLLIGILAIIVGLVTSCSVRPPVDTWAFCGVHPDTPYAREKVRTLAEVAGIDATFGPCLPPDWSTYSPANPGQRYATPEVYHRLVRLNAEYGMQTVVYDARLWADDPLVRSHARDEWWTVRHHIAGFDVGDEYDPRSPEWDVLVNRWALLSQETVSELGIWPYTNHLGWESALDMALIYMPGPLLSYDSYDVTESLRVARKYADVRPLMCAINALAHGPYDPTPQSVEVAMLDHRDAGCESLLIFGGDKPINTPGFTTDSLVTGMGKPTPLASAVFRGAS